LGLSRPSPNVTDRFADALDSMAMVEFLAILAEDCGVTPGAIEACVDRRFGTVGELAAALHAAKIHPHDEVGRIANPSHTAGASPLPQPVGRIGNPSHAGCWLAATAVRLPETVQPAADIDQVLQRPRGWLERHAGIRQRRIWANQDPLTATAEAGRACLDQAGLTTEDVGALLVTSEAPPMLVGLAAALHAQLHLGPKTVALEIGGACTGFLHALWTGQALLPRVQVVLVIAVEAATRYLQLGPGPAGEAAALFGDAVAAALLCATPPGREALSVGEVLLQADGQARTLLQVRRGAHDAFELHMKGIELAGRAVRVMAQSVADLLQHYERPLTDLAAVVVHGGNGRLPGLLARQLGLPLDRVWSETPTTGNLGSASLPVGWTLHQPKAAGPVIWTAVGAGLTWGAAMIGEHLHPH
jgi:3-oxoacyl-[acyl-carrier-protein] synthase-3